MNIWKLGFNGMVVTDASHMVGMTNRVKRPDMLSAASGDCDAAEKNGVHYYPILVGHEKESWDEAIAVGFGKLQSGEYAAYGCEKKQAFLHNLGG